jgi:hypothetical protein
VWRTYKNVLLLGKDNTIRTIDLGLVHSSAAGTIVTLILNRLRQDGDIEEGVSPNFLARNWSPAFTEWSTKSVRDAFFSSPQFPRLLNGDVVKDTIVKGVKEKRFAYVSKTVNGEYDPFNYGDNLTVSEVELSEDMFLITKETAEAYLKTQASGAPVQPIVTTPPEPEGSTNAGIVSKPPDGEGITTTPPPPGIKNPPVQDVASRVHWSGSVPPQKWMNFYTKVLSRFAASKGLNLTLKVDIAPDGGISNQKIEEMKVALRELGLVDDVEVE